MEDVIREIRIRGALQQPDWGDISQLNRVAEALAARPPLVQGDDLATLRTLLGKVAAGEAM
ncbi:3-deoxy-7-phosphoheptulonate synthase, partial [Streptomyces sp. NPDC005918]